MSEDFLAILELVWLAVWAQEQYNIPILRQE